MKKALSHLLIASLMVVSLSAYAKEPINLAAEKQELKKYHDSGAYMHDVDSVMKDANKYLKSRLADTAHLGKKPAIILDIDETSLSNYPDMVKLDFGGTFDEIRDAEDKGTDQVIPPTLALYQLAKDHNVAVFFLTGRFENERKVTEDNLRTAGYNNWDGLILRHGEYLHVPAVVYKTAMRKELASQGYNIILSAGDQTSDLRGGYADKTFKLPDPFYSIP